MSELPEIDSEIMAELVRATIKSLDESIRKIGPSDPLFASQVKEHANDWRRALERWERRR